MKRHKHNLSHYKLATMEMGKLYPIGCVEVLPGDSFQHHASALVRVSPQLAPIMHPVTVRIHHFYVPNRITWTGWENFITGGPDGKDATKVPTTPSNANASTVLDYMGIKPFDGMSVNALPVRAYNAIYNEFYRDQDLSAERDSQDKTVADIAWEKDYFSSARPWAQKGDQITLPLGTSAPITGIATADAVTESNVEGFETGQTDKTIFTAGRYVDNGATSSSQLAIKQNATTGVPEIYADLTQAGSLDINDMRRAFALQRYQEARAQYGSRYTEYLRYLGITASDQRLQRPEYLGGGKQTLSFSEVLQTAEGTDVAAQPLGKLGGHGIAGLRSKSYRRYFEEHGYVLSLMSVRPKTMYIDSVEKHWYRQDKEDYYQRELMQIGQQTILNKEIKIDHADPEGVFGFQDRYSDYKSCRSGVTSEFRTLLNYWHMGRDFSGADPALNESFVKCVPTKRIYAEQTKHPLWVMINHKLVARRLVAKTSGSRIL